MNFAKFPKHVMTSDDGDLELQRIRMKRMQALMKAKTQAEEQSTRRQPTLADKIDSLLRILLSPAAQQYLAGIKGRSVNTYNEVRSRLFPSTLISEIEKLMYYSQQGMIRQGVISETEVQYLERQVMGVGTSITVKKQGQDAVNLGSYLKEDD